jgi:hypothetical protein
MCHHGELGHIFECTMAAGHHSIDCGLIAPVASMAPSAIASVGIPSVSGAIDGQLREVATSVLIANSAIVARSSLHRATAS